MVLKDMTPEELLQSIHRVVGGVMQVKAELLHNAVENLIQNGRKTLAEGTAEAVHLTEREVDILRLLGNGDSNKKMDGCWDSHSGADELFFIQIYQPSDNRHLGNGKCGYCRFYAVAIEFQAPNGSQNLKRMDGHRRRGHGGCYFVAVHPSPFVHDSFVS